jgi:hypothetical protein
VQAVSSIHNLRTLRAVVTGTHFIESFTVKVKPIPPATSMLRIQRSSDLVRFIGLKMLGNEVLRRIFRTAGH